MDTLIVMLATYAFVVVALCAVWFVPSRKDAASGEVAAPLVQTVSDTCLELAGRYALSPRETEVFMLLAQGRTCSFVQEELVLAESTVKTHMSHIYAKLGVSGRQEMMDLLFGETKGGIDA